MARSDFIINKTTNADANLLADLIRESFYDVAQRFGLTPQNCPKHPSNCISEWIATDQTRGVVYFILSQDDQPIGCVGLEAPSPDLRYIERLAVLPQCRRRGFGRALVACALSEAKLSGADRIRIGIIADHIELKAWYVKIGFVEQETKNFQHLPFDVTFMELYPIMMVAGDSEKYSMTADDD
jgi:ribosomal protein S18 acetylase RimI-like enzyme